MRINRVPVFVLCVLAVVVPAAAQQNAARTNDTHPSIARQTFKSGTVSAKAPANPTDLYKLGVGDVLQISITNAAVSGDYYTIRPDGSIDFPLAGENPTILGLTAAEAENALASRITLYREPRVTIGIRYYASHLVTVTGMATLTGERALRREAMPLFTIIAGSGIDPAAQTVLIRRHGSAATEAYALHDDSTGDVLVHPGDSVEFRSDVVPMTSTRSTGRQQTKH